MNHTFDKEYWDGIWSSERAGSMSASDPNPHLIREAGGLKPGTAIDAGCGAGAEAIWLARAGWTVTAADVAAAALAFGEHRAADAGVGNQVRWVQADLSVWEPEQQYDLVTTHYAHPAMPQLEFYRRIASWVAPHGTLLIVGHLHQGHSQGHSQAHSHGHSHGNGHGTEAGDDTQPPAEASATAGSITELLAPADWRIETAQESHRTVRGPNGADTALHDVVVRAVRLP